MHPQQQLSAYAPTSQHNPDAPQLQRKLKRVAGVVRILTAIFSILGRHAIA
jgi:hypothetical protein